MAASTARRLYAIRKVHPLAEYTLFLAGLRNCCPGIILMVETTPRALTIDELLPWNYLADK
jgi:hypothetical protein